MKTMLYFIELDELDNFIEYEKYIKFLSHNKREQICKYMIGSDKKLSLIPDLMIRYMACKVLKLNNSNIIFSKNDYGKPYLVGFPNFNYNISYTRNAFMIGFSEKPIGVDIERIKPINLNIAERFFCKGEVEFIFSKYKEREKSFYEVWTQKEAYTKWSGKGLSIYLNTFDVTDIEFSKIITVMNIEDYIVSVCTRENIQSIDVLKLSERQVSHILTEFFREDLSLDYE